MDITSKLRRLNGTMITFGNDYSDIILDAGLEIDRLRAELAQCRKDAERYRWLLERRTYEYNDGAKYLEFSCDFSNYDDVNASIDAAMQGER